MDQAYAAVLTEHAKYAFPPRWAEAPNDIAEDKSPGQPATDCPGPTQPLSQKANQRSERTGTGAREAGRSAACPAIDRAMAEIMARRKSVFGERFKVFKMGGRCLMRQGG